MKGMYVAIEQKLRHNFEESDFLPLALPCASARHSFLQTSAQLQKYSYFMKPLYVFCVDTLPQEKAMRTLDSYRKCVESTLTEREKVVGAMKAELRSQEELFDKTEKKLQQLRCMLVCDCGA